MNSSSRSSGRVPPARTRSEELLFLQRDVSVDQRAVVATARPPSSRTVSPLVRVAARRPSSRAVVAANMREQEGGRSARGGDFGGLSVVIDGLRRRVVGLGHVARFRCSQRDRLWCVENPSPSGSRAPSCQRGLGRVGRYGHARSSPCAIRSKQRRCQGQDCGAAFGARSNVRERGAGASVSWLPRLTVRTRACHLETSRGRGSDEARASRGFARARSRERVGGGALRRGAPGPRRTSSRTPTERCGTPAPAQPTRPAARSP